MSDFVFALILGVGVGGLYAMLSTGLVTTYKGSGVINFAHGAFAMYTAYTYDEVNTAGQFQLPWVDILPTHGLNVPVTISVGVSTRCDSAGHDSLGHMLEQEGYPVYRGKTNLGLGHASAEGNSQRAKAGKSR